ncbi:MAG: hypothetical protein ABI445_24175 [Polyangia bacterium]
MRDFKTYNQHGDTQTHRIAFVELAFDRAGTPNGFRLTAACGASSFEQRIDVRGYGVLDVVDCAPCRGVR